MTRPSRNTDRLLIEAGKALVPVTGFSGLTVREVAKKARVNPGMFSYHFKTKDIFIERLLSETYTDFIQNFTIEAGQGMHCKERLVNAVTAVARFVRDNAGIVMPLIEEIIAGNRKIMEFARANMIRHISILFALIKECQKGGYVRKMPVLSALSMLVIPVVAPNLLARVFGKYAGKNLVSNLLVREMKTTMLSDEALAKRIEIALRGLSCEK